jgi:hypothetical protein
MNDTSPDATKPHEHWCEAPGCDAWGAWGHHKATRDGYEEHWFCALHPPDPASARPSPPSDSGFRLQQ